MSLGMKHLALIILFIAIAAISGCVTGPIRDLPALNEVPEHAVAITSTIGIVSDTQIHESRGTASRFLSKAGDEFVSVTIRTGQQVVGSSDLLYEALGRLADTPLVLHLGDAIDVSCRTEWDVFQRTMRVGRPDGKWLLGGGNHDGYYVGNVLPVNSDRYHDSYWDQVCNQGRYPTTEGMDKRYLNKRQIIDRNLQHLHESWNLAGDQSAPASLVCDFREPEKLSMCASWSNEDRAPWQSFLVQMARLPAATDAAPPVFALMLDSSTYRTRPRVALTSFPAGTTAGFGAAQIDAAHMMVEKIPENARFFLTAHHHISEWKERKWEPLEQDGMRRLLRDPRFLGFVVTAHTHEGGWYPSNLLGVELIELNTGSLADAPLYFRDLQFFFGDDGAWILRSRRSLLTRENSGSCKDYSLPANGSGYSVKEQAAQADRNRDAPAVLQSMAILGSALKNFFAFWRSKHKELNPQLLIYRDVVRDSMPEAIDFSYSISDLSGARPRLFVKRNELVEELEILAKCNHATECSIQRKGRLLKALEESMAVYSTAYSAEVLQRSHHIRLCAAIAATAEAGRGDRDVDRAMKASEPEIVVLPIR